MAQSAASLLAQRVSNLSEAEEGSFWQALFETLPEAKRLEVAFRVADSLPRTLGSLRSLLAVSVNRDKIIEQLAGEPQRVIDFDAEADELLQESRIAAEAVAIIWKEEMLSSSEAARCLGAKPSNREKVNSLRRRSLLLGLPQGQGHRYLYPAFQIDRARREIHPEVQQVNELLDAASDPWGVASWWVSKNGRLGSRPMDLVGTDDAESVVRAAQALLEPLG